MPYEKLKRYYFSFVKPSEEVWAEMEQHFTIKKVAKNDFLVKEGQVCREMNFLNSGTCRTFNLKDGKEYTTNFFFEGGMVTDYSSFIRQTPSSEYIQAVETCEVVCFSYDSMQQFYKMHAVMQQFGRLIAEKVFLNLYQRQQDLLLLSPKERYLQLLKRRPKVVLNLPQVHIASYLGITPEYLSRLRRELKNKQV